MRSLSQLSRLACVFVTLLLLGTSAGCGSKVSESNYYRVLYGMSEEAVEEVLGPARSDLPPSDVSQVAPTQAAADETPRGDLKVKLWSHGRLSIRVWFEN